MESQQSDRKKPAPVSGPEEKDDATTRGDGGDLQRETSGRGDSNCNNGGKDRTSGGGTGPVQNNGGGGDTGPGQQSKNTGTQIGPRNGDGDDSDIGIDGSSDVNDGKEIDFSEYVVVDKRLLQTEGAANGDGGAKVDGGQTDVDGGQTDGTQSEGNTKSSSKADTIEKRKEQKRQSKKRTMERARAQLDAEHVSSLCWFPRRCLRVVPVLGIQLSCRWQCDQFIRAHCAYVGAQNGINVSFTLNKVRMVCRTKSCNATIVFDWQPRSGLWKLNKYVEHTNECGGLKVNASESGATVEGRSCTPAYLPRQVARAVIEDVRDDPNFTAKKIATIVKAKGIYSREPSLAHYRSVRREIHKQLAANRFIDVASMQGYINLLRSYGHKAELFVINGLEMKNQRIKAAKYIFEQKKKVKHIAPTEQFDANVVNLTDIDDNGRYYGGFSFIPSVAESYCKNGRRTAMAHATHWEGQGPQSYGTTFEVLTYDANNNLLPIFFSHFVGSECDEYWKVVFHGVKQIPGFDVPHRTIIVDHEMAIDKAYSEALKNAHLFLDPTHLKNNMGPILGSEEGSGIALYERAVYAPSISDVESIIFQYGETQRKYLDKFEKSQLYRAYSKLEDTITCSQETESAMSASLRNEIYNVEPQRMLQKLVLLQRTGFLKRQQLAAKNINPVPPQIEQHLASIIRRARDYQPSVKFLNGKMQMEAHVQSHTDGSKYWHVVMPSTAHAPPSCCSYSRAGDGFPCVHGTAVIGEKHGFSNMHLFVHQRHLTASWKKMYENLTFPIPSQFEVDTIRTEAKLSVLKGTNVEVPKALPPPRGRPSREAGKRKSGFFARVPATKRMRSYCCSICHQDGHTAPDCPLRQLFGK